MDENRIKKVMIFKSGQFAFSCLYDNQKIKPLLDKAQLLYATIAELPLLPKLEEEVIRKSIFGTAAIEGNPLSEEEVKTVLTEETKKKNLKRVEQEIRNLKLAYELIKETKPVTLTPFLLTEKLIQKVHELITQDISYKGNNPGGYRNHFVKVGNEEHGGIYTPPKILKDVEKLMQEFIEWINSDIVLTETPVIRAALTHYYLGVIHPFGDGNGRTARAMEALLLKSAGIKAAPMVANFYYQNVDEYYWAFSLTNKNKDNQVTPFLEFFLTGLNKSLEEIKTRIILTIKRFALKDYCNFLREKKTITQRQHELVTLLFDSEKTFFSLHDLFSETIFKMPYQKVSERTARRDLQNLLANNILQQKEKEFCLNWDIVS